MKSAKKAAGAYHGASAIRDFLDPANLATPLVELPKELNPLAGERVRIFAKLMYLTPLFNVKLLAAWNVLSQARDDGELKGVHTLVENSSGNMALAEAVLAPLFGISHVIAIVPRDIAPGKLDLLRIFGVEPLLHNETASEESGIAMARRLGKQKGFFNPGQYHNAANPAAYEKWLAPQIWEQTGKTLSVFCAGLGTTGTINGVSAYFRRVAPHVAIVGVTCEEGQPVPGVRSVGRLKEIEFDWHRAHDHHVQVATKESFRHSLALCRAGLMAGPSSGFALAGLLKHLESERAASRLDRLRNRDGEVVAAFVCSDSALPYVEKYSTHLDPQELA